MKRLLSLTVLATCASFATADVVTGFEDFSGSAQGVVTSGQQGWYLPPVSGSLDHMIYTYAGNALGFPQNPAGGNQFDAGRSDSSGSSFARAQHDNDFSTSQTWTASYDFAAQFLGAAGTAVDNVGSFSLQPSTTSRFFIALIQWVDPVAATNVKLTFQVFDASGTFGGAYLSPGPAWDNLDVQHWYRQSISWDFATNKITEIKLTDLTTNVTTTANPTDWYLNGGANSTIELPTAVRMFVGGADNAVAWDNISIKPSSAGPRNIAPSSFTIFRGSLVSGGLAELLNSDDQYLVVRNGPIAFPTEAPITVYFDATDTGSTRTGLSFKIENKVSINGLTQIVDLFNYTTNSYDTTAVDTRPAPTTDTVVTITGTGTIGRFFNGSNGMRARLRVRPAGPLFTNNWRSSTDQVQWTVTP